jgi:hypothetical protein
MKINIELDDYACEGILGLHGYVSEEVTAYFDGSTDPYNNNEESSELRGINVKVAYHRMERPKELDKEHPMLSSLSDYRYEKVVENLFNSRLRDVLFNF